MIWSTLYFLCVSFKQLYKHIGKITSFLHSFLLAQERLEFGKALAKKIEQPWDINGKIRT